MKNYKMNLKLFEANLNTNITTDSGLSVEMKTFYDKNLLRNAEPNLVHDQFAQERDIPKNGGKKIEFRKYDSLGKALTPLTEGVTPEGKKLSVTNLEAEVKQYGDYVSLSDMLIMTAIDNNIVEAGNLIGSQAGETLDTISREVLSAGTNVQYAEGQVDSRAKITDTMKLTVNAIKLAARFLRVQNAPKINGSYYAIIHPDCAYDIKNDPNFIGVVKYKDPEKIYKGEIGELDGVRFIETTEAKKFVKAGTSEVDVYSTIVLGANAYGTTKVEGGGLQTIIKQLGSGGTADPLNQRATVGWKALKVTEILSQQYMVRIESASTFNDHKAN